MTKLTPIKTTALNHKKMITRSCLNVMILFLLLAGQHTWAAGKGKGRIQESIVINRIGFETAADYANWQVKKGALELSSKHQKQGEHSLLWQWKKGDELAIEKLEGLAKATDYYAGGQPEIYEPAFYQKGRYGGIKMWIYQEAANAGEMTFQVGHDLSAARQNPKYRFTINLNFTGWRSIWVQFNEDALVDNYQGVDDMHSLVATPSKEASKGNIYIDHFHLLEFVSYKRHSDLVFQNNKAAVRSDSYEILTPYEKYLKAGQSSADAKGNAAAIQTIEDRLEYLMLGGQDTDWKKRNTGLDKDLVNRVKKANTTFKKLHITQQDNTITGIPLFTCRDEHGTPNGLNYQAVIEATMFPLAMDYRMTGNANSKKQMMQLYTYLTDQGWQAGSALGTVDHIIRVNGFATALFLMREELSAEELLQQQDCLAWHTRLGNIIDGDHSIGENTDLVRGGALPKLISILLMPEGAQKTSMMRAFKTYMDYVAAFAPGYSDTVKPDYSIFHHRGTYLNAYGVSAVNTMAMIRWLLNGTEYALSEETDTNLKNTLKRQYEIAYGVELHMGVGGRFPYKNSAIDRFMLPAYAFMSMRGHTVEDAEMGAIYNYLYQISPEQNVKGILIPALTYSGSFGTLNLMVNLHQQMKEHAVAPADGNYSLPYSSLSVHRRDNWLATVKGYDKYVWDYETGNKGENNLGRYLSHGALFLFKSSPTTGMKGAGMEQNSGFHWGYLPGATTKALPIEKVYYENKPTEKYKEGFHRSFTETTFARGLSAEGKNGLFALELRDEVEPAPEQVLFDASFRARKSYFFFEDEIVCLGSDIYNDDAQYHTITTLFQNNIGQDGLTGKETYLNGQSLGSSLTINKTVNGGVLTDVQGIQYIIPGTSTIRLEQADQQSLQKYGNGQYKPITTPHVKAWIDHGTQPNGREYEYLVLMNASTEEALKREDQPGYEVLQKDSMAHIVKHHDLNTTGYAIFKASENINKGLLSQVDTPVMLMIKEAGQNAVMTVANPDLKLAKWNHNMSVMPNAIVHEGSQGSIVTITLKGHWKPAGYVYELLSSTYADGQTTLQVYCKDGKSIDVPLRKK